MQNNGAIYNWQKYCGNPRINLLLYDGNNLLMTMNRATSEPMFHMDDISKTVIVTFIGTCSRHVFSQRQSGICLGSEIGFFERAILYTILRHRLV